jgi:hypothetical protein
MMNTKEHARLSNTPTTYQLQTTPAQCSEDVDEAAVTTRYEAGSVQHPSLSWHSVERLPAYEDDVLETRANETILAERTAPSNLELKQCWGFATPELPFGNVAARVLLTPLFIYVERIDGLSMRVARSAIHSVSEERGWKIFGVTGDEPLVFRSRGRCAVARHLCAALRAALPAPHRVAPYRRVLRANQRSAAMNCSG